MKRLSLDFGRITKGMKLKFNLLLDDPIELAQKPRLGLINAFSSSGNTYITFRPHPFVSIDITDSFGKKDAWNSNKVLNINLQGKRKLEFELIRMIRNFQIPNLFIYKSDGSLMLNKQLQASEERSFVVGNKICKLQCAVIKDDDNSEYEGIIFMINAHDSFCNLTIEEAEYLLYTLQSINMPLLSMQLLSYYEQIKDDLEIDHLEIKPNVLVESIEEEKIHAPVIVKKEQENMIPNLDIY